MYFRVCRVNVERDRDGLAKRDAASARGITATPHAGGNVAQFWRIKRARERTRSENWLAATLAELHAPIGIARQGLSISLGAAGIARDEEGEAVSH
jgi:hypothetical protein